MKRDTKHPCVKRNRQAFTLAEMLIVVALAAMIMVGAISVYNRIRMDARRILEKLDENRLAEEVLQRMAEDVDRVVAPGFNASLQVHNKKDNGLYAAQLIIENKYFDGSNPPRPQLYERVIWQTMYDAFDDSMLLYRMHSGLNVKDKVLDEEKSAQELNLYVPVASGITFFEIQAVENQKMIATWEQPKLPKGIRIGISFAPLEQEFDGQWVVPEENILYRTVAIGRTRPIAYKFQPKVFDANDFLMADDILMDAEEPMDSEEPTDTEEPTDPKELLPDEEWDESEDD